MNPQRIHPEGWAPAKGYANGVAARGAQVFVCGLDADQGIALAGEINGASYAGDLTVPEHAETCVAHCLERYGRIDALFNVAGASGRRHGDGPLHLITDEGWDWTLDANLKSMFLVSRSVLRRMMARRGTR